MIMARASSSEDDFPNVESIVRKHKQKSTGEPSRDGKKAPKPVDPLESGHTGFDESTGKTPAATRRRRKLGQGQPVESSLVKPWKGLDIEIGATSRASGSKQPTWSRTKTEEVGNALAGELLDRLPVKAKRAESRVSATGTALGSPPEEPKRTRRLISRAEKKALEQKREQEEDDDDWIVSSNESESDDENASDHVPSSSEDEASDFVLGGTSDSDDLAITPPRRAESPSVPRRMPRRVLSSSRDPSKKEPTQMKAIQDDTTTKSKKRIEKHNVPKISATRQLKAATKGKLEDAFQKLKIFNEGSDSDEPTVKNSKAPILEPSTPKKNTTTSPGKTARIPDSPWKPEHKEFWDPEVNFAWIDKHSPPKKAPKKMPDLAAPDSREELKRRYGTSPEKKQAKKAFDAVKEDLAREFLRELDEVVTDGKLEVLTESTGGLRLVWSNTLLTTAGRAHWKCKTTTTTLKQPSSSSASSSATTTKTATQHYASIELATKVLSNESDLLNTVAHEFCHLAVFLLHGKPKLAHGTEFKTYGRRVMTAASCPASSSGSAKNGLKTPRDRGVEINVTTRHSYEIEYRFVWRCADCAAEVCRHSRSVDPTRQRCGRCKGVLVQVKPVPRGSGTSKDKDKGDADDEGSGLGGGQDSTSASRGKGASAPKPEKKKTAYQEFTSREMKALSISHKGLSFKEKMAMVSARWSEHQKKQKEKQEQEKEKEQGIKPRSKSKSTTPEMETAPAPTTTVTTKAVGIRELEAAVEVLEIRDDGSSSSSEDNGDDDNGAGAVYDIFA